MVPFLDFDLSDAYFFGRFLQRFPMPAIGIGRRDLARMGVLEDAEEVLAGILNHLITRVSHLEL